MDSYAPVNKWEGGRAEGSGHCSCSVDSFFFWGSLREREGEGKVYACLSDWRNVGRCLFGGG